MAVKYFHYFHLSLIFFVQQQIGDYAFLQYVQTSVVNKLKMVK